MKIRTVVTLLVLFLSINFGIAQEQDAILTPLEIVNKRMNFYNEHDFKGFIKLYDDNVKIYTYPNKLLGKGADNISSIFKPKFTAKSIKVEIVNQMTNGNHVINHETVTENGIKTKYISIYEVKNGLIMSVRFIRDN